MNIPKLIAAVEQADLLILRDADGETYRDILDRVYPVSADPEGLALSLSYPSMGEMSKVEFKARDLAAARQEGHKVHIAGWTLELFSTVPFIPDLSD